MFKGHLALQGCHTSGSRINADNVGRSHTDLAGCDVCHRGNNWNSALRIIGGIAAGTCTSCHSSTHRSRKNRQPHPDQCEAVMAATTNISPDCPLPSGHSLVAPGGCANLSQQFYGPWQGSQPYRHQPGCDVPQDDRMDSAAFSHAGVAAGSCATCHNGSGRGRTANPSRRRQPVTPATRRRAGRPQPSVTAVSSQEPARAATTVPPPAARMPTT